MNKHTCLISATKINQNHILDGNTELQNTEIQFLFEKKKLMDSGTHCSKIGRFLGTLGTHALRAYKSDKKRKEIAQYWKKPNLRNPKVLE